MKRFAELLDRLVQTPSRNGKLTLMTDYFRTTEDPDRGLALAAITGDLDIAAVKPAGPDPSITTLCLKCVSAISNYLMPKYGKLWIFLLI